MHVNLSHRGQKPNSHMTEKKTRSRQRLTADRKTPPSPTQRRGKAVSQKQTPKIFGRLRKALWQALLLPFRMVWAIFWRLGLVICLLVGLGITYFASNLPEPNALIDGRAKGSVTLMDRNGDVFAWRGDQFGGIVTAQTVSPFLKNAVVATEDRRFYSHFGLSPRGVASAVRINLRAGRGPLSGNGGSTITQQTAKLICLGVNYDPKVWKSERAYERECRRTTLWRKIKEAIFALAMEAKFSKDEILTIYLNRASWVLAPEGSRLLPNDILVNPQLKSTPPRQQ